MGVIPPAQSKNDTDLKFGTHTPIDLIYKMIFFSKKITLTAASLDELPCQVDFLQISSISLYILFLAQGRGIINNEAIGPKK